MGIFSNKYLEEGYYVEDEMGNLTKVFDKNELIDGLESNRLFYYDGITLNIVNSETNPKKNRYDDVL